MGKRLELFCVKIKERDFNGLVSSDLVKVDKVFFGAILALVAVDPPTPLDDDSAGYTVIDKIV